MALAIRLIAGLTCCQGQGLKLSMITERPKQTDMGALFVYQGFTVMTGFFDYVASSKEFI
jgi:hypothetical protein